MHWPYLTRQDVVGIVLLIIILGGLFFAYLIFPNSRLAANFGFGRDWDCSYPGKGEPICIKRPSKTGNLN
jgi:hypothetical protein